MTEIKQYLQQHYGSMPSMELFHTLDNVKYEERDLVFAELLKRVEIGGRVYIKGTDLQSLCTSVYRGHISAPEQQFAKYKSLSSLSLTVSQLESMKYSVLISERNGLEYFVVGKRNV
jgi:hypothetical protein